AATASPCDARASPREQNLHVAAERTSAADVAIAPATSATLIATAVAVVIRSVFVAPVVVPAASALLLCLLRLLLCLLLNLLSGGCDLHPDNATADLYSRCRSKNEIDPANFTCCRQAHRRRCLRIDASGIERCSVGLVRLTVGIITKVS